MMMKKEVGKCGERVNKKVGKFDRGMDEKESEGRQNWKADEKGKFRREQKDGELRKRDEEDEKKGK